MKLGQYVRIVEGVFTFKKGDIVKCVNIISPESIGFKGEKGDIWWMGTSQYEIIPESKHDQITELIADFKKNLESIMAEPEPRKVQKGDWVLMFDKDGLAGLLKAFEKDDDGDWVTENGILITFGTNSSRRYFISPLGVWTKKWERGMEPKTPVEFYNNTPLAFSTLKEAEKYCVEVYK